MSEHRTNPGPTPKGRSMPVVILLAVIVLLLIVVAILWLDVTRLRREVQEVRALPGAGSAAAPGGSGSTDGPGRPGNVPDDTSPVARREPQPPPVAPAHQPPAVTRPPDSPEHPPGATPDQIRDALEGAREASTLGRMRRISTMVQAHLAENDKVPESLAPLGLEQDALQDGWGRAVRYDQIPPRSYRIVSAGSDGTFDTSDDLVCQDGRFTRGSGGALITR